MQTVFFGYCTRHRKYFIAACDGCNAVKNKRTAKTAANGNGKAQDDKDANELLLMAFKLFRKYRERLF